MAKVVGEAKDILEQASKKELVAFNKMRKNDEIWQALLKFVERQKQIKLDKLYRLRRPRGIDDVIQNMTDHEYYCGRIAAWVVLLHVLENAEGELEKRSGK